MSRIEKFVKNGESGWLITVPRWLFDLTDEWGILSDDWGVEFFMLMFLIGMYLVWRV